MTTVESTARAADESYIHEAERLAFLLLLKAGHFRKYLAVWREENADKFPFL